MRDFFRKAAAIMAAAVITASAAVSCSSKSSFSSDPNNLIGGDLPDDYSKDLEDMPYGGEYQKFEPGDNDFPMGIDMDPRFVTIDEASALTNYFYSVNNQDVESFKKAVHPDLIKYRLENSEYSTEKEFLDAEYELLKQYTGSDFTFDYILIDGRLKDTEGAFEQYDKPYAGERLCDPKACGVCARVCPTCALSAEQKESWHVGSLSYDVGKLDVNGCAVACFGFRKELNRMTSIVVENDHPDDEELAEALEKQFAAPGFQTLDHVPMFHCDRCMIYCPVGNWNEQFRDRGLTKGPVEK